MPLSDQFILKIYVQRQQAVKGRVCPPFVVECGPVGERFAGLAAGFEFPQTGAQVQPLVEIFVGQRWKVSGQGFQQQGQEEGDGWLGDGDGVHCVRSCTWLRNERTKAKAGRTAGGHLDRVASEGIMRDDSC